MIWVAALPFAIGRGSPWPVAGIGCAPAPGKAMTMAAKVRDESVPASSPKRAGQEALSHKVGVVLIRDVVDVLQGAGVESPDLLSRRRSMCSTRASAPVRWMELYIWTRRARWTAGSVRGDATPAAGGMMRSRFFLGPIPRRQAVSFFEIHGRSASRGSSSGFLGRAGTVPGANQRPPRLAWLRPLVFYRGDAGLGFSVRCRFRVPTEFPSLPPTRSAFSVWSSRPFGVAMVSLPGSNLLDPLGACAADGTSWWLRFRRRTAPAPARCHGSAVGSTRRGRPGGTLWPRWRLCDAAENVDLKPGPGGAEEGAAAAVLAASRGGPAAGRVDPALAAREVAGGPPIAPVLAGMERPFLLPRDQPGNAIFPRPAVARTISTS